jgi:hypothetical protein
MSEIEMTPDGPLTTSPDEEKPQSELIAVFELGRKCGALNRDDAWWAGYRQRFADDLAASKPTVWRSTHNLHGAPRRRSLTHPKGRAR